MVKQKTLKSWLQKSKSRRHIKSLADARLILRPSKAKRGHSDYSCSVCGENGALLACIKCLKLFHLMCLETTPHDLPLSEWACKACSLEYYNDMIVSLESSIELQKEEKEAFIKKLTNKTNKARKNTKLKEFEAKYPGLVRHGQIQYPIDDEILWAKPKLHNIQFSNRPVEHFPQYPDDVFSDLVFICDFTHTFQDVLAAPALKCETLYACLSSNTENLLAKKIHISLIKPLVQIMLKTEAFRKSGNMLNYLVYKTKKLVSIDKMLEFSYLTFIENLFQTEVWKGLIEEVDKDLMHTFKEFSFVDNYHSLPVGYRLKILVLFTSLLLETKKFNEECNRRLEVQGKLFREISELQSQFKNKKTAENEKSDLETKLDELKTEIKRLPIRTLHMGTDRYLKEYFFFPWDSSKLFIKSLDRSNRESFKWSFYDKRSEIENLIPTLCGKGTREASLINILESILLKNEFFLSELDSTSSETNEDKKHIETVYNLKFLKDWVRNLHVSVAEAIQIEPSSFYLKAVETSDFDELLVLIVNFHQAFSEYQCSEEPYKVAKKVIGLWDFNELNPVWENAVKECRNVCEALLCMHLLESLVEKFNKENKVICIVESAYSIARRSYRLERLNKMKKEVEKEQDVACFICGEYGLVACCDKCPKVAHLECLKIENLPEGEWICPVCVEKANSVRVTRSRQIKY